MVFKIELYAYLPAIFFLHFELRSDPDFFFQLSQIRIQGNFFRILIAVLNRKRRKLHQSG